MATSAPTFLIVPEVAQAIADAARGAIGQRHDDDLLSITVDPFPACEFLIHSRDVVTSREMERALGQALLPIVEEDRIGEVHIFLGERFPSCDLRERLEMAATTGSPLQPTVTALEDVMKTPASEMTIAGGQGGPYIAHAPSRGLKVEVGVSMATKLLRWGARLVGGVEHRHFPTRNVARMTADQLADAVAVAAELGVAEAGILPAWIRHGAGADYLDALLNDQPKAARIVLAFLDRVRATARRVRAQKLHLYIGSTLDFGRHVPHDSPLVFDIDEPPMPPSP